MYNLSTYDYETLYSLVTAYLGIMGAILLFSIVFSILINWKIFEKAGFAGWKCLIPFYNNYCLADMVFHSGIMFLLLFIPGVNIIFALILTFKMAGVFGKGAGFGLGLIFLPIIFMPILAFGKAEYVG